MFFIFEDPGEVGIFFAAQFLCNKKGNGNRSRLWLWLCLIILLLLWPGSFMHGQKKRGEGLLI